MKNFDIFTYRIVTESILWDMSNKKLFSFNKQNNAAKAVNHFIILANRRNRKDFYKYYREKSEFSKYKVMIEQVKKKRTVNKFFNFILHYLK